MKSFALSEKRSIFAPAIETARSLTERERTNTDSVPEWLPKTEGKYLLPVAQKAGPNLPCQTNIKDSIF